MKKNLLNSSFEFAFPAGIVIALMLPSLLMVQQPQPIKVTIQNSDTIVNGKNIKDLSAAERKNALQDINGEGKSSFYVTCRNNIDGKDTIIEK